MKEEKKPERNFELRSEKVRSIVGQIPSSLIRYGITAIGMVLLCLFAVAYYCPINKYIRVRLPYTKRQLHQWTARI